MIRKKGRFFNRIKRTVPLLVVFAVLLSTLYTCLWNEQFVMGITRYELESDKIEDGFTVAVVADLHNHRFGEDNAELIAVIAEEKPDIIAIVGDIIIRKNPDISVVRPLIEGLCKIAPVYFAFGNHEEAMLDTTDILFEIEDSGATILSQECEDIEINGELIRIGGLDSNPDPGCPGRKFLDEYFFEEEDVFKLLLCHKPEFLHYFMQCDIDLVLCGHAHGGQIILPGGQGVYSPEQGWWPKYTEGLYKSETATMIITRGLGNAIWIPRINNASELVIVKVK